MYKVESKAKFIPDPRLRLVDLVREAVKFVKTQDARNIFII